MNQFSYDLLKNTVKANDINLLKDLTMLKCLYSKQLSRMPREYLVKLLFDTVHQNLVMKVDGKILAGITFRGFDQQVFYEVAFLAVNNQNQCQGLGSILMNKFKNLCQQRGISHIFTFADNGAVKFFQKHGFSKHISLDEKCYKAYIKEYIGGQLMQCKMDLKKMIDFQNLRAHIKSVRNRIIYGQVKPLLSLAPYDFQRTQKIIKSKADKCKTLGELAEYIPGLKQAGYEKEKYKNQDKKLILSFLLNCQTFIELAAHKASHLKQGIYVEQQTTLKSNDHIHGENQIKKRILHDYFFLLYKMERKLKFGYFKYKDEITEYFTSRLKQILPRNEKLRPNEREFWTKIEQLKYDFMKNQITCQMKTKKSKSLVQQKKSNQ